MTSPATQLAPPSDPLGTLPDRPRGSIRRSTTVDILRPDGLDGDAVLVGRGRDLRTDRDGLTEVHDVAFLELRVDYSARRTVRSITSEPRREGISRLVGTPAGSGFRARVAEVVPDEVAGGTVLHQLLDDVPGLTLIGGYASTITAPQGRAGRTSPPPQTDICAGWQREGTMVTGIMGSGRIPLLEGPHVAAFTDASDPLAWHAMPDLPSLGMRRHRMLEVTQGPTPRVACWFRDVFRSPDGADIVVHEYSLDARVDAGSWRVVDISVHPRVLPWLECPQAVPSGDRLRGATTGSLRGVVRTEFTGTTTCTHLNDQYRSLADIQVLYESVGR